MNNPINNTVFDSRDLIEYRDELEQELIDICNDIIIDEDLDRDDIEDIDEAFTFLEEEPYASEYDHKVEHCKDIRDFCDELEGYGNFEHGESIIHENYFEKYCEDLCDDIGAVSKENAHWVVIDWTATADNLKMDYTEAEFEGETYYMRV